jgi:murein DD-endopeptidase MepM/ murein hydrolase activator NlpD
LTLMLWLITAQFMAVQGDTVIVPLTEQQCLNPISVFGKSYECRPDDTIVVGVDIEQKPGTEPILVSGQPTGAIEIAPRAYRTRRLPPRLDPPNPVLREKERAIIRVALSRGPELCPRFPAYIDFHQPVDGMTTGQFGDKRIYGTVPSPPHHGTDISAPANTPVTTASYGQVVLVDSFSVEGLMVIVYHGSGVYSLYLHLSNADVQVGQVVNRDSVIGLSGASGSTLGPHLHFGMFINGATVDPLKFIEKFNRALLLRSVPGSVC